MTLYIQYTKNLAVKESLPFELLSIWAVYLEYIVPSYFFPIIPNLNYLIGLVHQETSHKKVDSIGAYMCSIRGLSRYSVHSTAAALEKILYHFLYMLDLHP